MIARSVVAWLGLVLLCACDGDRSAELADDADSQPPAAAAYVGSRQCAGCHTDEAQAWEGSHHALAMTEVGDAPHLEDHTFEHTGGSTRFLRDVTGFVVETEGASGELERYAVRYAFGFVPLQQYLVDVGGGRLQALQVARDTSDLASGGDGAWFHLLGDEHIAPDDVLHWTGSGFNWNYMCADCHSTSVQKGYDVEANTYDTTFAELSVGCEACHGPGSAHVAQAQSGHWRMGQGFAEHLNLGDAEQQIEVCAPCHSRRAQLAEGFRPGADLLDSYLPSLLDQGLYYPDGQIDDEVYVYGSFLQSKMHASGVACADCHDPHSAETRVEGNGLCMQCHSPGGQPDYPRLAAAPYAGTLYDSPAHHFHEPGSDGAQCTSCHMPERTYMVVDPRRDHSFGVPRPDLSVALGTPNACQACHAEEGDAWAAAAIATRHGGERAPSVAATIAAGRTGAAGAEMALAAIAKDELQPAIWRATALSLLAGYNRHGSGRVVQAGLQDGNPLVRIGALRGARRFPPDRRWALAADLLTDVRLAVRREATMALMDAGPLLEGVERQRYDSALDEHLETLAYLSDRAEGQTAIAGVYLARGDVVAAETALTRALERNPSWVPALLNLADLKRATGRDAQAEAYLNTALELAGDTPDVLLASALWLVRQGRHGEALPRFEEAYEHSRTPYLAYVYALAVDGSGDRELARRVVTEALARFPFDAQLGALAESFRRGR